jgi:hypothetical protein
MKEQLYTIPVTDAFNKDCECPLCIMKKALEINALEYTMGPSYMEDDVRAQTDKVGFCEKHIKVLAENQNHLGLALILNTHMNKTIKDLESLTKKEGKLTSTSVFKTKSKSSNVKSYIDNLEHSCFICENIEKTFHRYLHTIFYLYKHENEFKKTFAASKGFCIAHYGILYEMAPSQLKGDTLNNFIKILNTLVLDNLKRVNDDLDWFIDKFDYRNHNAPWKNSKDAVPRTITKTNSTIKE